MWIYIVMCNPSDCLDDYLNEGYYVAQRAFSSEEEAKSFLNKAKEQYPSDRYEIQETTLEGALTIDFNNVKVHE